MRLTYKFKHRCDEKLVNLCKVSNNLYNQAMFIVKKTLSNTKKWVRYTELDWMMKEIKTLEGKINYRLLRAQVAQQTLKILDSNWKAYFRSIKEWKTNPSRFSGMPHPPGFKTKGGMFLLVYPNQSASIKENFIRLDKELKIPIPEYAGKDFKNFQQIRIIPKTNYFDIEIIYNQNTMSSDLLGSKYLSIDLGINNFSTCVSEHKSFILNGKVMKSVNQYYNKKTAEFRSIRDGQKSFCLYKTKLRRLLCYRNDFIKDVLHKYSRAIIRFCLNYKIGNIVVGYNKAWKTQLCLGRVTNQNFQGLPFQKFISYLKYKSDLVGINLIEQEESYTSKCDSLAMESVEHHDKYIGKRIKRGLFQSAIGKTINADVNGSFNTLRKVIGDSDDQIHRIINSGFLFNPVKIRMNDLSNFYKERVSHTLCD